MPSEASKRMAQEFLKEWMGEGQYAKEHRTMVNDLAALLDQRAEAAEAKLAAVLGAVQRALDEFPWSTQSHDQRMRRRLSKALREARAEAVGEAVCPDCARRVTLIAGRFEKHLNALADDDCEQSGAEAGGDEHHE